MTDPVFLDEQAMAAAEEAMAAAEGPPAPHTHDYTELTNRPTLGSMAQQNKSVVDITGGTIAGITDLAVADGGTGASTPANARTNLGLKGAAVLDVGTIAGTVAAGNDPRLSDARTPTAHSHPVADVTGLATVATSGAYADLSGRPALSSVATSGAYADLSGKPALSTVATSGSYTDLSNRPALPTVVRLVADHAAFSTGSLVNVSGLSFAVTSGTYYKFLFEIVFRTAALTTGAGFGLTIPAASVFAATVTIPFAADGAAANWIGFLTSSGDSVLSTGVQAAASDYIATVEGIILPSANGTVQLQAKTEVATSALTVRAGSQVTYST